MTLVSKLGVLLGTGLGTGFSPVASGTVGTLLGIPLVLLASVLLDPEYGASFPVLLYCLVLSLVAVPICQIAENHFQKKDDGRIVADEYLTFPICMIGIPLEPTWFLIAFLSNRFFDIVKVPPAYQVQRFKGGVGIVLDDVIAALYSLAFNHLLLWSWLHYA
jgi:phosphatidylglycerophosphatase A